MLRLSGDLDLFRMDSIREELHAATLQDSPAVIELDCSELLSIHREGIRMLFELGEQFRRPVVLTGMNDDCRQRIRLMGLEHAFEYR